MVAVLLTTLAFFWHGVHMSTAAFDYRSDTHNLEIQLTVSAQHLEEILNQRSGRQIELDRTPDAGKLAEAYVLSKLELKDGDNKKVALKWVGLELKGGNVNCYVEAKLPSDAGIKLRNEVLLDWQRDQINRVLPKRDGKGKPPQLLYWVGNAGEFQTLFF